MAKDNTLEDRFADLKGKKKGSVEGGRRGGHDFN
jgi:hypothetical protein